MEPADPTYVQTYCGKVFRDSFGVLSFHCTICFTDIDHIDDYAIHVEQHFGLISDPLNNSTKVVEYVCCTEEDDSKDATNQKIPTKPVRARHRKTSKLHTKLPKDAENPKQTPSIATDHTSSAGHVSLLPCKMCSETFSTTAERSRHKRSKHSSKTFKCEVCGKCYARRFTLNSHMTSHTGEKPFKCDICLKSFPHRSYINIHMRVHSGDKPFQCSVCGAQFISSSKLSFHRRRHDNDLLRHNCPVCGKGFRFPKKMKEHMNLHTGTKPFTCDICGKAFTFSVNLSKHAQSHTGAKPYKCKYCDVYFSQSSNRRQHERQRHEYELNML